MSIELLLQKLGVITLLLSFIPGYYWGWRFADDERNTLIRVAIAATFSLIPPCVLAMVFLIGMILVDALKFIFS